MRAREACGVRSAVDNSELIKKYMPPCGQSWPEGPIRVVRTFLGKQKTASRGLCGMLRATFYLSASNPSVYLVKLQPELNPGDHLQYYQQR